MYLKQVIQREWDKGVRAFTLLELLVVIMITAVLSSFVISAFQDARKKAEGVACMANMRSLCVALQSYMQDHDRVWPQPPEASSLDDEASWWIATLTSYGPKLDTWQCPARERSDEKAKPGALPNTIDYLPALFDERPGTAYKWPRQPWLIEIGINHPKGGFALFPDGSVTPIQQFPGT